MGMSTFRTPVGPESPNVYWRRRLIVGIGALAVIVIILLIVFAPKGSKTPTGASTTTPPSNSSTPVATSAAGSGSSTAPKCAATDLVVTATVDKPKYTVEEQPQFGFTIENKGKAACTATAGSDVQAFTVTSGKDTVWASTDCQTKPTPATVVIKAGDKVTSGLVAWDRTRSSKTTCSATRTAVAAGFYHITVTVNGIVSATSPQFQLT
jgi:hypothetical protein